MGTGVLRIGGCQNGGGFLVSCALGSCALGSALSAPGALGSRRGRRPETRPESLHWLHFLCILPLTTFESGFARERRRLAERAPRVQPCARRPAFAAAASKRIPRRGAPHARSPALEKSPPILRSPAFSVGCVMTDLAVAGTIRPGPAAPSR